MAGDEVIGTREAFFLMLQEPAVNKKLGVSKQTVTNWKSYVHEGKVSLDKMEEMLLKYGAEVVQEKIWKL